VTLEVAAVPLALAAGVLGIVSPCVWPLVPVVTSSAATGGRSGPFYLALGMSLAFAAAGTVATLLLTSSGMDPELLRYVAAGMLALVGLTLLVQRLGHWVTLRLSMLAAGRGASPGTGPTSPQAQFGVGALLGVVWLPCVGPTLGAAIALASLGQDMGMAFLVMLAYGVGTAGVLLAAGLLSAKVLARWRPRLLSGGGQGRRVLGSTLLLLGVLVLTGLDKVLEAMAVNLIPAWIFTL
jgi:cytochrome c-type biogenesis protein